MLEKKINIRASYYRFSDKVSYYKGFTNKRGQEKEGTKVAELLKLAELKTDFTEVDIKNRNQTIIEAFLEFLRKNNLEAFMSVSNLNRLAELLASRLIRMTGLDQI